MMRIGQRYRLRAWRIAWLALWLLPFGSAAAQGGGCAQPRSWRDIYPQPGQPRAEVSACLNNQAWEVRNLKVPFKSAVGSIEAQCEVWVIFFEGPSRSPARFAAQREINGAENEIFAEAAAAVTHFRRCLVP
jgi:hypothetical protein